MATSTDVREWLKANPVEGEDVPERGPLPKTLKDRYTAAHPEPDDVTSADDYPPADDTTAGSEPGGSTAGEQRPRRVKASGGRAPWQDRLWGRAGSGKAGKPAKPKPKRIPLVDFVEEIYSDLAGLAGDTGLIPLQRCLQFQAPYAGVIAEQQIKGTIVDTAMQPLARASGAFSALNGLVGTPLFTVWIMAAGGREERPVPVVDQDGQPVHDKDTGEPAYQMVMDFDSRTKMMFFAHKYCLLQMSKVTAKDFSQIQERADLLINRAKEVARVQAWMFGLPEPAEDADPSAEEEAIARAKKLMGGR